MLLNACEWQQAHPLAVPITSSIIIAYNFIPAIFELANLTICFPFKSGNPILGNLCTLFYELSQVHFKYIKDGIPRNCLERNWRETGSTFICLFLSVPFVSWKHTEINLGKWALHGLSVVVSSRLISIVKDQVPFLLARNSWAAEIKTKLTCLRQRILFLALQSFLHRSFDKDSKTIEGSGRSSMKKHLGVIGSSIYLSNWLRVYPVATANVGGIRNITFS